MTKKRRYLSTAAILLACVGIALVALAMLPPRPGVTKAYFDRIEVGMTLAEVQAVFASEPIPIFDHAASIAKLWSHADGSCAQIDFDGGTVCGKQWHGSVETIPDKLRRWLGLVK